MNLTLLELKKIHTHYKNILIIKKKSYLNTLYFTV